MKKILEKIGITGFVLLAFISCETVDLDLAENPNRIRQSQANPTLVLNQIQLSYANILQNNEEVIGRFTRINPMILSLAEDGSYEQYFTDYEPINGKGSNLLNNVWTDFYVDILSNHKLLIKVSAERDPGIYDFNVAVSNILLAHLASLLTDQYGPIPFSEASLAIDNLSPKLDTGEEVYEECFRLLNEAIVLLSATPTPINSNFNDIYYEGDAEKWVDFANSLKLRMYKNTGNKTAFDAIIRTGNYITDTSNDIQFTYVSAPQSGFDYPSTIGNVPAPKSNWLMNLMDSKNDPRIRYYFYRQRATTPGIDGEPADASIIPCSVDIPPTHYAGFAYCAAPNGYIGRSHGDNTQNVDLAERRPDDVALALYGVYPFAGLFDNDVFLVANNENFSDDIIDTRSAGGVMPILTASSVDFWRGQMSSDASEKAMHLRNAMEKNIAKVQSFISLDARGITADSFVTAADVTDYINDTVGSFLSATGDDQEDIFAEQYFISLFGGATESYNYYRKTGYPTTLAPSWNPNPGPFPRTIPYPEKELNNPNIPLIRPLTTQVFWDNNPASPAFPIAN